MNAIHVAAVVVLAVFAYPSKQVDKTAALEPGGRVYVRNDRGTVEIEAWDKNEVSVHARIEPRNFLGRQNACIQDSTVRVDSWPASLRITPEYAFIDQRFPRLLAALFGACTERPLVHYRISVPRKAQLTIDDAESKIKLTGLAGNVLVRTGRGTVQADRVSGRIDVRTTRATMGE